MATLDAAPAGVIPAQWQALLDENRELRELLRIGTADNERLHGIIKNLIDGGVKLPPGVRVVYVDRDGNEVTPW